MSPLALLLSLAPSPVDAPPEPAALRARAVAHEAAGESIAAGDTYLELADTSDVDRLDALDRARKNYDAAYLTTRSPRYLCWALGIAEQAVRAGEFASDQEALSWRDNASEDLARLQTDAQTTGRANCRFDATGLARRPRVLLLPDADFVAPPPTPTVAPTPAGPPAAIVRRRRAHVAAGTLMLGLGVGSLTFMTVTLDRMHARTSEARDLSELARDQHRGFTEAEQIRLDHLRTAVAADRVLAIGSGLAVALTTATAIAVLLTRHGPRRGSRLRARLAPRWRGAALRLEF